MSPELLVTLLLFMVGDANRRGYRHLLDAFWDEANFAGIRLPVDEPVSAAAFCQARSKLSPEFLRALLHKVDARFDSDFKSDACWEGRRLLAVDGTTVNLQRSEELFREFRKLESAYCPQAMMSSLFNVVSKVPVDVALAPHKTSERQMLINEHLPHLRQGDILILDRGYPGFKLFETLLASGIDFVVRACTLSTFPAVTEFLEDGGIDRTIVLEPTWSARSASPLSLRAVRSKRPNGEEFVLLTTLKKSEGYSRAKIEEIYRMRWEIEEHYKAFKSDYIGQGQFHSKSASGVRQEVFAVALFHALSRYFLAAAAECSDTPYDELSTKSACLGLASYIVRLLLADEVCGRERLRQLLVRIARTRDEKRPGRSFPRRSVRPRTRWGPRGRTRD